MARRRGQPIGIDDPEGWPRLQASLDMLVTICENDFPPNVDMRQAMGNYSIVY
eukprot:SAG11_NODE_9528_length_903_cov_0.942786_1_plen_52_part_10